MQMALACEGTLREHPLRPIAAWMEERGLTADRMP